MGKSRLFALRANDAELAKIKIIKQDMGVRLDSELIRIMLNETAKKILSANVPVVTK